ncbi:MAG: protein kinase [Candidatus Latescibacteria bacterium]|nr:protein kinase [Candidatus Latescibacterota bacterium]NIM21732.1 protein kinase [Candidatus Latescibacterota bacterium]NIM65870.1 protein kinase [Candidatus Latescibacterota bacterium]NIO02615.1 protein kinase [Candidatus Latescibacterota bacterium]NIO29596.1 protein kinase [Candidatus Latescibacterota bacterium]
MIGQTISHYKILEKIGEGGMGVVYKAEDLKLKRTVALKFLTPQALGTEEEKTRFIHEAQAAAALDHSNISTIHEIDEAEGRTFIAMAFVEGQSLRERIASGPLKLNEALDIAIQIGTGLHEAHEKGIVHRDIKSANIMVTEKRQAKIMDFGLALLAGATRVTTTGSTVGTIACMSPEQAQGATVDHRTDIWSLGVVLYEMVTGQLPFKIDYDQALVYAILNDDPEPMTGLRTGVPLELERIAKKCMEKNPGERYQTAADLLVDLCHLQKTLSAPAGPSFAPVFKRTSGQRARRLGWTGVIILIVALAAIILLRDFLLTQEKPVSERKMLVVLPFENLGPPEDEFFAAGITEEITSRLASVRGLGVISRKSAVQYASTEKTTKQIGEELGVDYMLEGTVRWAKTPDQPHRVRITPQLIRISDDTHLWSEPYEHVIDDIFQVQSTIAQEVVEQLGITLLEPERSAIEARPTEDLEAYQAYLRGRYYAGQPHFSLEGWNKALQSYQHATELDPEFALAYAELSKAHARLYYLQHDRTEERRNLAKQAVEKALELAPESPEVHLAQGYFYFWTGGKTEQALEEFAIAARDLPESADVLKAKAEVLRHKGRWQDGLDYYREACKLSPLDASAFEELAITYWWMRRYPEASDVADKAIALAPDQTWPYLTKAFNYWSWKGAVPEVRAALEAISPDHPWAPWARYWCDMYEGNYRGALDHLTAVPGGWIRLKICARPTPLLAAYVHELLNEPELAMSAYQSATASLEDEVRAQPENPMFHSSLGIAYAALGYKEEAIREGKRALELYPFSKDVAYSLPYIIDLAHIYAILGEHDAALDELEHLLSIPGWMSVAWINIDPRWNPLRNNPKFQRLMDKYSGAGS